MAKPLLPLPDADNELFWRACLEGKLIASACADCGAFAWPPAPTCARCGSAERRWEELSGKGVIWTYTRVHHAFHPSLSSQVPYVVALIDLDGGPRIVGKVRADGKEVAIGSRVRVGFEEIDGMNLPYFELEG